MLSVLSHLDCAECGYSVQQHRSSIPGASNLLLRYPAFTHCVSNSTWRREAHERPQCASAVMIRIMAHVAAPQIIESRFLEEARRTSGVGRTATVSLASQWLPLRARKQSLDDLALVCFFLPTVGKIVGAGVGGTNLRFRPFGTDYYRNRPRPSP
jgi:hypothetical protein